MSYEEWLAWAPESRQSEWVGGEAIEFMPPKTIHALVLAFLDRLVGLYVVLRGLGQVIPAPFEMRLTRSSREPDLVFIATEDLGRLTAERLVGPATLAIELISDDSVGRDRVAKFLEYQEAGIQEYWIIDPRPRRQDVARHALGADGRFAPIEPDADGRLHSAVLPGFWLDPTWLWQDPLPDPLATLLVIAPDPVRAAVQPTDRGG